MKKIILLLLIFGALGSLVVLKTYQISVEASPSPDTVTDSFTDETKVGSKENLYINTTAGQIMLGILCYCDKDVDGYYATTTTIVSAGTCSQGGCSGSRGNDCDDNNASIYPGVQVGTKDCSGNNYYFISGTQSATTTSYCKLRTYGAKPIICQNDGTYSDPSCDTYSDITKASCGSCKYVNQCNASAQTCANYPNGTRYSSCKWCQNGGIANVPYGQDPFNDCYPSNQAPCRGEECNGAGYCTVLSKGSEYYCTACRKCDGIQESCLYWPPGGLQQIVCCDKYSNYTQDTTPKNTCNICCYNGECDPPVGTGQWSGCLSGSTYLNMTPNKYCSSIGLICGATGDNAGLCFVNSDCTGLLGGGVLHCERSCSYYYGAKGVKFYCRESVCP